jgi:hypothetical protein
LPYYDSLILHHCTYREISKDTSLNRDDRINRDASNGTMAGTKAIVRTPTTPGTPAIARRPATMIKSDSKGMPATAEMQATAGTPAKSKRKDDNHDSNSMT